jgi:DNA topoisomerase-1
VQSHELSTLAGFYGGGDGTKEGRIEVCMSLSRPRSKRSVKPTQETVEIISDPVDSAKAAGLRYVTDAKPGIQRHKRGSGFRYVGPDGGPIRDHETLSRIKSLVIPPAWQEVWICVFPYGHLQATGRDARGRKQSRYHPRWREVRDETKYGRMLLFGNALPVIRKRVEHDLSLTGLPREKVLATIVRLIETTFIRVGNAAYARENKSFGLTTMRTRHLSIHGNTLTFDFQGKSGVHHTIDLQNRHLATIVKRIQDLPGYELFQYVDEEGGRHAIDSSDVNDYLREMTGEHFTAKDFRTWAGTVLTAMMLRKFEPYETQTQAKKNVVEAIKAVAEHLGNTPAICRKCYVHPAVLEHYFSGAMLEGVEAKVAEQGDHKLVKLRDEENALLHLLALRNGASA